MIKEGRIEKITPIDEAEFQKTFGKSLFGLNSDTIGKGITRNPFNSNTVNAYYAGILEWDIDGGLIDNVTYSSYFLTVNVHHKFTRKHPDRTPLYFFWGYYDQAALGLKQTVLDEMPIIEYTGGPPDSTLEVLDHRMIYQDDAGTISEKAQFIWTMSHDGVTNFTVTAQTMRMIFLIVYVDNPLETTTGAFQGGGGGILAETIDIYLET